MAAGAAFACSSPSSGTTATAGAEWRDGAHDDLVLAVALAAWFGENDKSGYVEFSPDALQRYTQTPDGHWMPDCDDDWHPEATSAGFRTW